MKRALGQDLFNLTVTMWKHNGVKPHQANVVTDWLDSIFEDRMKAMKSQRWTPGPQHLEI